MKKGWLVLFASAVIGFFICLLNAGNIHDAYSAVIIYPLAYAACSFFVCSQLENKQSGGRMTVTVFLVFQWLRFVLLPVTASVSGYLSNPSSAGDEASALAASLLCLYELIVSSLACFLLLKYSRRKPKQENRNFRLLGNQWIYVVFVAFAVMLYLLFGRGTYTFFSLSFGGGRASSAEKNLVLSAFLSYGNTFLGVLAFWYLYKQYQKTGNEKYFWFALVFAMLKIGVISSDSESRLSILYSMGTVLLLLPKLFPGKSKITLRTTLALGGTMIFLMTVYKAFHAYVYGSYTEALVRQSTRFDMLDVASMLNINFYGVQNVARNIYISRFLDLTTETYIADLLNNTFGLNRLFSLNVPLTIASYNLYIYEGSSASGYLYSAIAYGYQYYGAILAPMAAVINLCITVYLENKLSRIKSIDVYYITSVIYIRYAYTMFTCFPQTWNYVSRTVVIGALVMGGSALFTRGRMLRRTLQPVRE